MAKKIKCYELDFGDTNLISKDPMEILQWIKSELVHLQEGEELQYSITIKMMTQKQINDLPE